MKNDAWIQSYYRIKGRSYMQITPTREITFSVNKQTVIRFDVNENGIKKKQIKTKYRRTKWSILFYPCSLLSVTVYERYSQFSSHKAQRFESIPDEQVKAVEHTVFFFFTCSTRTAPYHHRWFVLRFCFGISDVACWKWRESQPDARVLRSPVPRLGTMEHPEWF